MRRFENWFFLIMIVVFAVSLTLVFQLIDARYEPISFQQQIHPADVKNVSGIAYDGKSLWITEEGTSKITKVNPVSGQREGEIDFPVKATGGSAWDGESLWQLAWEEKKIYQINPENGDILKSFPSPGEGTCSGMTFDGNYLWLANFEDEKVYQIDQKNDGKIIQVQPGNFETTGLAWDGQYLWSGLLVGTKTHDEVTPFTGFVQQKVPGTRDVKNVLPLSGVGTGGSNWTPANQNATVLWWFDMYHQKLVEIQLIPRTSSWLYKFGAAGLLSGIFIFAFLILNATVFAPKKTVEEKSS